MKHGICHLSIVPIRKENSHQSELVSQLLYGDCFKIISIKKDWVQLLTLQDEYSGWIDHKQFKDIDQKEAEKISAVGAQYSSQLVDFVETEDSALISIVLGSNVAGANLLKHTFNGSFSEKVKDKSSLIKTAYSYLNSPYLWGGKTPMGIDCSGLIQMIYRINGYNIPRDASQQVMLGETLSFIDESEPGDLAFFDDQEGAIIHVGLLLENYHILHAHGKVRIDRIDQTGIYNFDTQQHSHKLRIIKKMI
ncbi:C40 family peptidase [Flavobacteriaceae bacterium]|nr:C40 family peptidase [Flavobacteriaceae bacterium]MDA8948660.1 C40 family peptidase [Flavobacteriaceae bacterium]MDA9016181.1 C40 family peptidase [Flavobacteriaceae bacterium]MDB3862049.1 C40 family peptidase [Flavobacteriaceae bacterium]